MSANTSITLPPDTPDEAACSGVSFELLLDQGTYFVSATHQPSINATLILSNLDAPPLSLAFAGGQQFDVDIRDASDVQVALWSTGRIFDDLARAIEVQGERRWQASLPVPPGNGTSLAPVIYTATAYLTPSAAGASGATGRSYSATVGFSVRRLPVLLQGQPS
nr:BsuPI-related putative proteinase inhibitor [uncultured Lichenicoccus sp.]